MSAPNCRVAIPKGHTVPVQPRTLQLLPGTEHPSYAGAAVEILEGLDGRLPVRHEGCIVPAQEAPPSPVFLRNGHRLSATVPVAPSGTNGLGAGLWREGHGASNSSSRTAAILSLIAGPPPSTAPAGLAWPLCLLWPNLGRA